MQTNDIETLIEAGLAGSKASVRSADGTHFEALVIAAQFADKATLARHRLVYATLGERVGREIHALALKTMTPAEWEAASRAAAGE